MLILRFKDAMQTHAITTLTKAKELTIGKVSLFVEYDSSLSSETLINSFIKEIPHSKNIGYAGFETREYLQDSLSYNIIDPNVSAHKHSLFKILPSELIPIIEKALRLCHTSVTTTPTHIFLFPTFSEFVKDKMNGVSGYTPYKNTLLLFVSPTKVRGWKQSFTETICHEFMHTVMDNHYERKDLLDDLVFEGIAESFVSFLFGTKPRMPSQALSEQEALKWYMKLKKRLRDTDLYYPVFLEGKEWPLWAGYSIGYRLVETYRKQHPQLSWDAITRLTPQEIYEETNFGV